MNFINRFSKTRKVYLLIGLFAFLIILFYVLNLKSNKIYKGVTISDIDISGLSRQDTVKKLNDNIRSIDNIYLIVGYQNNEWKIPYRDLNIKFDIQKTVDNAFYIGRNGTIFKRAWDIIKARLGQEVDIVLEYDTQALKLKLDNIYPNIEIQKKDAVIVPSENGPKIIPHTLGKKVDKDKSFKLIDTSIKTLSTDRVNVVVVDEQPKILAKDLENISDELSTYFTKYSSKLLGRTHNLKVASARLNGILLKPNEVFSMDKTIMDRTIENGYKIAKAYFADNIVNEVGGGVCQITTTLYDAVLLADLQVIEREQHSMMVGYVPPGYDAAISDKGIDFKFRNSKKQPIYIYSDMNEDKLIINIYGKADNPNKKIELESQIIETLQPNISKVVVSDELPSGYKKVVQKPINGCKATLYKKTYINGELISREPLYTNKYRPLRGKVIIGR